MRSANQSRRSPTLPRRAERQKRPSQSGTFPTKAASAIQPVAVIARVFGAANAPTPEAPAPSDEAEGFQSELLGAALLSAVAGYVDAAGFLALFGMFTAHVTGDLVAAGAVVAERTYLGLAGRLGMIPVFMLSVAATALFTRSIRRRGQPPLAAVLALMTIALTIFCVTGVALHRFANRPDAWAVALTGATGVIAMGIQNTLMRDALSGFCPTTVMTGNLTQVTIELVELALPTSSANNAEALRLRAEARRRLAKFGAPLTGFVVGAVLGGWITGVWGLSSIALPAVGVGALTVMTWRAPHPSSSDRAPSRRSLDSKPTPNEPPRDD